MGEAAKAYRCRSAFVGLIRLGAAPARKGERGRGGRLTASRPVGAASPGRAVRSVSSCLARKAVECSCLRSSDYYSV